MQGSTNFGILLEKTGKMLVKGNCYLKKLNRTGFFLATVSCPWKKAFALKLLLVFVEIAVAFIETRQLASTLEKNIAAKTIFSSNHWNETET